MPRTRPPVARQGGMSHSAVVCKWPHLALTCSWGGARGISDRPEPYPHCVWGSSGVLGNKGKAAKRGRQPRERRQEGGESSQANPERRSPAHREGASARYWVLTPYRRAQKDTDASAVTGIRIGASQVQGFQGPGTFGGPQLAVHVQGDALLPMAFGPDPVDALLGLAVAAVAPLHRVAGRSQQLVVEEHQRLLQVRAEQLP